MPTNDKNIAASRKDFSTPIGIGLAFLFVIIAISESGGAGAYFDAPSLLIVLGGTCAVTLASFSLRDFFATPKIIFKQIWGGAYDPKEITKIMLGMADDARKKGMLSLQQVVQTHKANRFLYTGVSLIIDGVEVQDVERILRQDMHASGERHLQSAALLRKMAEISPAMGLIGTLIGLVQMLGSLDDPSKIGPSMALALLTTFYGAMFSYAFFSPLAAKLERNSAEEILVKTLMLRSVVSIAKQEHPRRLEILLNTILPPASRVQYFR